MHRILLLFLMTTGAAVHAAECGRGSQPYKTYCVSDQMINLIACIDATGGNKDKLDAYLDQSQRTAKKTAGSVSAQNKFVGGGVSIDVEREAERRAVLSLGTQYFSGAVQTCAAFASKITDKNKQSAPKKRSLSQNAELPSTLIVSGSAVNFPNGLKIGIEFIGGFTDAPLKVTLITPENGYVNLKTDGVAENISYKGVNYKLFATKNEHDQVLLTLGRL